jgi:hypothetical protein
MPSPNPGETMAPSPDEVRAVAAIRDPALRNLRITQAYHELALELDRRVGGGSGANWCTFGTWASRQAGFTIRREDLRRTLEQWLGGSDAMGRALDAVVVAARALGSRRAVGELRATLGGMLDLEAAAGRASDAVGRGNVRVFEEIGLAVALLLDAYRDGPPGPGRIEAVLAHLVDGDPPSGQSYLRRALLRYHQLACGTPVPRRDEILLLANLEIGFQEQARLQPEIRAAVEAAAPDPGAVRIRILEFLFHGRPGWLRTRAAFWRTVGRRGPLDRAIDALLAEAGRQLREAVTREMMTLELPGGRRLRLGEDLAGEFPPSVAALEDPALLGLLRRLDPTPDSLAGSGARDWADLHDRMHFIIDLFRLYHEDSTLHLPPFTPHELEAIRSGRMP